MIRYRFEYCGNPSWIEIHLTAVLTDSEFTVGGITEGSEQDQFRVGLFRSIPGALEVRVNKYSVTVERGAAFTRDEVLASMLETCRIIFPQDEFEQLPTYREDIAVHQCADCAVEQDRAMKESMRDFETLEY